MRLNDQAAYLLHRRAHGERHAARLLEEAEEREGHTERADRAAGEEADEADDEARRAELIERFELDPT